MVLTSQMGISTVPRQVPLEVLLSVRLGAEKSSTMDRDGLALFNSSRQETTSRKIGCLA